MSDEIQVKTNFTAGEISPRLLGRGDIEAYQNGARSLANVIIHPMGGVGRRPGLAHVLRARGAGRLVAFESDAERVHLLVFTAGMIDVVRNGVVAASLSAPWTVDQLARISWARTVDTLLICHPEVSPRELKRDGAGNWTLREWSFASSNGVLHMPFHRFADAGVTLTTSGIQGVITVAAPAAVFDRAMEGTRLQIGGRQVRIDGVSSSSTLTATVIETLTGTGPFTDWAEQAFSPLRGWPVCATFFQCRLVVGGSRDLPNRVWMSHTSDTWNFSLGTGLDDEGIEFAIMSDQVNAVRAVFVGRHLQILTSGGEYMVSGSPVTPTDVSIDLQTGVGSRVDRSLPPRGVDGATIFLSRDGRGVYQFLYSDSENAYQAADLALVAEHMIDQPVDQDYASGRRLLLVVMANGEVGALTVYRSESVSAWSRIATDGKIRSVAVVGDDVFFLVERENGAWLVERLDDDAPLDLAVHGVSSTRATVWRGFDHLEGCRLHVVADGLSAGEATVSSGAITLAEDALDVWAGIPFTLVVEPTPPNLTTRSQPGVKTRLVAVTFRLYETAALSVDTGRGVRDIPLRRFGSDGIKGNPITGDRTVRSLGWRDDIAVPLWRIEQSTPLPLTLLSATTQLKVNN